jgi:16S rRNA (uracil1498-N3)-methyltransferase
MNLLVLESSEIDVPLPRSDRRVEHVRKILKKGPGDTLAAGIAGGPNEPCPLGTARVESWDGSRMIFSFREEREAPPLRPVELVLGFPRPIQANRILKDLASLGVRSIHIAATELGEKSYADSTIFKEREFRRPLLEGAEQAGNPRLPSVSIHPSLAECLKSLAGPDTGEKRWALDPYRSECLFGKAFGEESSGGRKAPASVFLAVGSERGWTDRELDTLAASGFRFASLGDRILRTETACTAAVVLALAGMCLL